MKFTSTNIKTLLIVFLFIFSTKIHAQTITIGVITGSPFCRGASFSVPYTVNTLTGTFNTTPTNTFSIEMSDEFGNFPSPFPFPVGTIQSTTSNSGVSCTIPLTALVSASYVFRIVSNSPIVTSLNVTSPISIQLPVGNPTTDFGTSSWNAYAFSDNNFTNYAGSFNIASLDFDSQNSYNAGASPSSAAGYSGCAVPTDNHSVKFKRQGFPCDFYQIDIPAFDENIEIFINGSPTPIYANNTPSTNISNIARVFLGATSTVEVRLREFTGTSNVALRFTPVDAILTSPIVYKCSATAVILTATSSQSGLAYAWTQAGLPVSPTVNPVGNTTYVVTVVDPFNPACSKSMNVDVIVTGASVTTVSPSTVASCGNAVLGVPLTASGAYTYSWTPATGLSATVGNTVIANPATPQTYTVTGNNGCGVFTTATVTVTVGNGGGNPTTFGAGQWNVYAYNGSNFNTYAGYYIEPATVVSFDSAPRWTNTTLGSPSSASGYVGCNVGVDNHSVVYKRKGFPCGRYQLDIPTHDDDVAVFVNGVPVFQHLFGCCDAHANIWTGYLDATSEIEYRWQEGILGSQGALNIVPLPTTPLFNTTSVNVCPAINQTVTANVLAGATYVWTAAPGLVSSSANVATVNGLNGTSQAYTVTATLNGCSYSSSVMVNFTATTPVVTITAPITTICGATPVTLTANGATTYSWSPGTGTGLSANTGASVTANPTATQTYTVTGFNGCGLSSTATVTVTVPILIAPSTFGAGIWNAYVYSGTGHADNNNTTSPLPSAYQGYYTENTLDFFSPNVWVNGGNGTPSSVANYVGCPVGEDAHSVVYKREGFPCGYYSLDIRHDDRVILIINGTRITGFPFENDWDQGVPAINVWTGFLGANSTIEMRWIEGGGGSNGGITFNTADPQTLFSSLQNGVTMCEGLLPATLTANAVTGVVYTWAVTSGAITLGTPSLPSGTSIDVSAPVGSNGTGTVICTATAQGCSLTKTINFTIQPNAATSVTADKSSICLGETIKLTATGATNYTWTLTTGNAPTAGLSVPTGSGFTINSTPTTPGTYTYSVAGSNNCNTLSQTVTVIVLGPIIGAQLAGTNEWNVFCYAGTDVDNLANNAYKGHYKSVGYSFDSRDDWGGAGTDLSSPYEITPIPTYVGCQVPINNHVISYKRQGFDCGSYKIGIAYHDDGYRLFVNNLPISVPHQNDCCDSHPNVWNGFLDNNSIVEFRWRDGTRQSRGAVNISFSFVGVTTTTWTGAVNTRWNDPANWCITVPDALTNVIIPPNAPNMPVIDGTGGQAQALNIEINSTLTQSGSLTIQGANSLNIYGNWTNNGIFVANTGTVNFIGTASAIIGGTNIITGGTNPTTFFNLNQTTNVTLGAPVAVNNTLSLNDTQLSLNNNTLTINNTNPTVPTVITRGTGFILSETNVATNPNVVCWNAGTATGNFVFPFGVNNSATGYIPVTFNKTTATNYSVCMSTRSTPQNNSPIATGANLGNIYGFANGDNVVDRWWDITRTPSSVNTIANPADITLSYRGIENTITAGATSVLAIQHFDDTPAVNAWDSPYAGGTVGVTSGIGTVTATGIYKFSPHVIVPILTPLPIELLYFSARKNNAQVDINWETITEKDNNFFNVERSSDNVRFESIGMVLAKKTIGNKIYNLVDKNPLSGTSYYRLKQTDNDGKISYSKSVSVNFGEKNTATLDIFPNPTTQDNIGMLLLGEKEENYSLSISNMEGKVIFSQNIKTDTSGKYKATLPMQTNLAQGVYVMKAVSENNVFVKKIIIQ